MSKTNEINNLLREYKNGNGKALESLMLLVYKDLFLLSYSYLKDKMLAEDVVSDVFLKLIEKCHMIKNEQNLSGYLKTITINKSIDILRKRKNDYFPGEETINRIAAEPNGKQEYVRLILSMLDAPLREILLLWQYGYTLNEMSKMTNLTVNQVRLLLQKAKESFSEKYHKYKMEQTL